AVDVGLFVFIDLGCSINVNLLPHACFISLLKYDVIIYPLQIQYIYSIWGSIGVHDHTSNKTLREGCKDKM
ncbi:hypothetical protein VIGAN_02004900, partial [Vigna angularis var. angularis]